jgi:very-short-patch-repair endonuclease
MFKTHNLILDHAARELCRKLRKSQTEAELIFWTYVRGRKFKGLKFYRQCPIFYETNNQESFFIADFFCFEKKIVIEIDGKIHDFRKKQDLEKLIIIENFGLKIIRIKNEDVEFDIKGVLKKVSIHFEDYNQECR